MNTRGRLLRQLLTFAAVGTLGFVVNAGIVELLAPSGGPLLAQVPAFPVAVAVTWWLNRRYTFGPSARAPRDEFLRYAMLNGVGWLANNGAYFWLIFVSAAAWRHPVLAVAAGSIAGMAFNFLSSRLLVFNRR